MTHVARLVPLAAKEVQALWIPWAVCAVFLLAAPLAAHGAFLALAIVGYIVVSMALGVMSIGREYTDHTLEQLLTLPVSRRWIWGVKQAVLAVMVLTLAILGGRALASMGIPRAGGMPLSESLSFVPYALFVAPTLTMALRSPAAGAACSALLLATLSLVDAYFLTRGFFLKTMSLALGGACGVCGWWIFDRLEAAETRSPAVHWPSLDRQPRAVADRAPTRRHPIWLLVAKELRLQQLAVVLGGIYLLAGTFAVTTRREGVIFVLSSPALSLLLPIVISAFASAEERQLGTLDWQALMPVSRREQWLVKLAVAMGLVALLGVALPTAVRLAGQAVGAGPTGIPWALHLSPAGFLLCAGSLYVSTLCRSGIQAFLFSLVATQAGLMSFVFVGAPLFDLGASGAGRLLAASGHSFSGGALQQPLFALRVGILVAMAALVLRYAYHNHRASDRDAARIGRQLAVMIVATLVATWMLGAASGLLAPRSEPPLKPRVETPRLSPPRETSTRPPAPPGPPRVSSRPA